MEPINRNSQNMQRQSSSGDAPTSQPRVHGYWNGRAVDKHGTIVMIPTPGLNSTSSNDEQPAPDNHQTGSPSDRQHVAISRRPSNISSGNDVQTATDSHPMGPPQNQQPEVVVSTPVNSNYNGNQVQSAADNSHWMEPAPNRQPAVVNHTPPINTSSGNEVQYAAYGDRLGIIIPKPSNANGYGNEVQPAAAQSHRMGTPQYHQSVAMNIPNPDNACTSNAVQPNTSQGNVIGTGSLHPDSSIASSNFSPAGSISQALTSRVQRNNMMVSSRSPFSAQGITASAPNFYRPNTNQNLNCVTPNANQSLGSTGNLLQNPQANSSWRSHVNNLQSAFVSEQHRPMLQGSINRSPAYLPSSSSNTNGVGCIPTSSNCPPMMIRPPSQQQELLQAEALKRKQMEDQKTNACLIRFKNYLNDWHHCVKNNATEKWNRFVAHYYAPEAKRFCCHAGLLGQSANNARRNLEGRTTCAHCHMNSNKSQEVPFPELAIVFQHKFTEYKDERLLQFGQLNAKRSGNDTTLFLFKHVIEVAETDQFLYLRKGPLAIQFKADLKILSWQFCMSSCEEVDRSHAIACSKLNQMLQNAGNSSRASGSQLTSCQQTQNQPILNSSYPSTSVANNNGMNSPLPQLTNSTNIFGTSASAPGSRHVTATPSSSVNPNASINPLPVTHHVTARPLPGPSSSTNKLLKRATSTENGHVMDDLQQRVNRQRLDDASISGLATGNGSQHFASTSDQTQGLAVDRNMDPTAEPGHWHGIETSDTNWDSVEIEILESLVHSTASRSASSRN